MTNLLSPFVHEYDFPYHNILKQYKEEILNQYFFLIKNQKGNLTDFPLPFTHPLTTFLNPLLNKIVTDNFIIEKPIANHGFRIYIQNNQDFSSFYHSHKTTSSISGVFYLDPPKEGGEITFLISPDNPPNQRELIIKPKKDKVYFFPYWIFHKPLPQKDEEHRICFNWLYGSSIRPIHKSTLIPW